MRRGPKSGLVRAKLIIDILGFDGHVGTSVSLLTISL